MSKIIIVLAFIMTSSVFYAQNTEATFFTRKQQVAKFHTITDLESYNKGELLKLYKERIDEIMITLPYISLTNKAGVKLGDIGIKEDARHLKILKSTNDGTQKALVKTGLMVEELIPFADTEKIIWAILFYEEMIKKMRIGSGGNY